MHRNEAFRHRRAHGDDALLETADPLIETAHALLDTSQALADTSQALLDTIQALLDAIQALLEPAPLLRDAQRDGFDHAVEIGLQFRPYSKDSTRAGRYP